jgi:hypothetical protein
MRCSIKFDDKFSQYIRRNIFLVHADKTLTAPVSEFIDSASRTDPCLYCVSIFPDFYPSLLRFMYFLLLLTVDFLDYVPSAVFVPRAVLFVCRFVPYAVLCVCRFVSYEVLYICNFVRLSLCFMPFCASAVL